MRGCWRKILRGSGVGVQVFWSFAIFALIVVVASLTFRFIYINTHRIRINERVLGSGKSLSLCASYFYLFSLYSTRLKTKHKAGRKNECHIFVTFYYKHKRRNKKKCSNNRTGKKQQKTSNTAEKLLPALEKIGSLSKKKIYTI